MLKADWYTDLADITNSEMNMKTMNCNIFKYIISQIDVMSLSVSNGRFINGLYGQLCP